MKKRILILLLTLCLVVGMMPTSVLPVLAAVGSSFKEDNFWYTVLTEGDTNTVSVTGGFDQPLSGDVIIPETVENNGITYTVASIGDSAFWGWHDMTSVTIPGSVTSIGKNAFQDCTALTSVTIPDGVTSIGEYAFNGTALTSVTIPGSVTSIGNYAFESCGDLTSVTIPDGVTSISNRIFCNCTALTSVTIPDSVTSIGYYAFYGCDALTSVTIPSKVTSIGGNAFADCNDLTSVTIPDNVISIGESAFEYCDSLGTVIFGESSQLSSIGARAFRFCTALNSITIPSSVTSIDSMAFSYCNALTSITLSCDFNTDLNNTGIYIDGSDSSKFGVIGTNTTGTITVTHTYTDDHDTTCNVSGCTETRSAIHTWATTLTWDETGHWYACSGCTEKDFAQHSGTADDDCKTATSCTVCSYEITAAATEHSYTDNHDTTCNVNNCNGTREAIHTYGTEWKSDKDNHWHECSCGDIADTAAHTPKVVNAKEATATEKGYTGDTVCEICGYEIAKGEDIPVKATPAGTNEDDPAGDNPADDNPADDNPADDNPASPPTGDNSNIFLWMAMLFVSGLGVVGATVLGRKRKADR